MQHRRPSSSRPLLLVLGVVAALALPAAAQRGGRLAKGGGPRVGELVPAATVFDEKGKVHGIRDLLKGHTTAIVFGCLT